MLYLILYTLVQVCFSAVTGGLITWLTGKVLSWDELTFRNSVLLNATLYLTSPIVPLIFFYFEFYIGSGTVLPMLAPDIRLSLGFTLMMIVSIVVWVLALKYIFGWEAGQSCIFCCAQGCVTIALWVVLIGGLGMIASGLSAGS